MTTVLKVKQGLSAPVVSSIPEQWNREWFRRFITNYLQNADVRNTTGATGGSFNNPPTPQTVASSVAVFTSTAAGTVPASGGGTTNFIRADGTWAAPAGSGGSVTSITQGAGLSFSSNPLTTSGTIAVNFAMVPTWTGIHTFTNQVFVNGPAGTGLTSIAFTVTSGFAAAVGGSDILVLRAGSTVNQLGQGPNIAFTDSTNNTSTTVQNSGGQTEIWQFNGSWIQVVRVTTGLALQARGPTNGMTDLTPDTGSFTGTLVGGTTSPTMTISWSRVGQLVTMTFAGQAVTSNATSFSITGLPAALQPATLTQQTQLCRDSDNGVGEFACNIQIVAGSGTINLLRNFSAGGWTAAGTKAINGVTFCYSLK